MRLLRGGNDGEVAAMFSGTYPTVLSQFTITNTITNTLTNSMTTSITTSIATRRMIRRRVSSDRVMATIAQ